MRSQNIQMSNRIKKHLEEFYPRECISVQSHIQWDQLKVCIYKTQDSEEIAEQKVRKVMQILKIPTNVFLSIYVSENPEVKYKEDRVGMWGKPRRIS